MSTPSKESILFNGGAVLLILIGAGAMIKAAVAPDQLEPCTVRYFQGTVLGITRDDGTPLTPGEIQSGLGAGEWGMLHNLTIEQVNGQQQSLAMRFGLSRAIEGPQLKYGQRDGVGFKWNPGFPSGKKSACLSYNLWVPEDFKYSRGGYLPGLYGGSLSDNAPISDRFSVRFRWAPDGRGGVRTETQQDTTDKVLHNKGVSFELPKGRWVSIEQEITLNSPGYENGKLWVWVDGQLIISEAGETYRTKPGSQILGVHVDTHYRRVRAHHQAEKAQSLLITPFELRWQ